MLHGWPRRLLQDPLALLSPYARAGHLVLEPGAGSGFFTLPLARLVQPGGRVVAVDLQPHMLEILGRRAAEAGVAEVIELRPCQENDLQVADLAGQVDLALALYMLHEVPDQAGFLGQVRGALKDDGRFLVVEPKGHVGQNEFLRSLALARLAGLETIARPRIGLSHAALMKAV